MLYPHLPEGYTIRAPRDEEIETIIDLIYAFERNEIGEEAERYTAGDLHADWLRLDLATDAWCLVSQEGELSAYGTLWSHEVTSYGRLWGDGYVHPAHQGRGLGATLLDLMEARSVDLIAALAQPGTRQVLSNHLIVSSPTSRALMEAYGYTLLRVFFTMRLELIQEPAAPVWPAGISVRICDGSQEDLRRAYETIEEGFKDHFAHSPQTFEDWRLHTVHENFDPSLWFLAVEGDVVVGAALCRMSDTEAVAGMVAQLAVLRPWRKRGLASALLYQAFGAFYQRGFKRVSLGVDGESLTGAQRVYERAGMSIVMRIGRYEKELRAGRELHPGRME